MNKIYLDNQSTTPVDPKVLDCMLPYFTNRFGNAASKTHSYGWEAEAAIEIAREKISKLINCNPNELIFTSGATESNNIAISCNNFIDHILTLSTEHRAILDICDALSKKGKSITYIKPKKNGIIDLDIFKNELGKNISLVSIMHANNEIGVVQPIKNIGKSCQQKDILFHVDAAQSIGKISIDVKKMNIDLMSISSHKIYGPKGIGALYINHEIKNKIKPIFFGGGQENGFRPGTLPVPLIVGFGKACDISYNKIDSESAKILKLRNLLMEKIITEIPDTIINGCINKRLPGNINLTFPSLKGQSIIASLPNIAISSGSACTSSSPKPSHVLLELGLSKNLSNSSIRVGIGRFNTEEEIIIAANSIIKAIKLKS